MECSHLVTYYQTYFLLIRAKSSIFVNKWSIFLNWVYILKFVFNVIVTIQNFFWNFGFWITKQNILVFNRHREVMLIILHSPALFAAVIPPDLGALLLLLIFPQSKISIVPYWFFCCLKWNYSGSFYIFQSFCNERDKGWVG